MNFNSILILTLIFASIKTLAQVEGGSSSPAPYVIMSSGLIGANVCFDALNTFQIIKGRNNKVIPITGIFTGLTEIILGATNYSRFEDAKELSIVNIGLGSITTILSSWNLLSNRNRKEKKLSLKLIRIPTSNNSSLGFSILKTF